jgi:hypothetical protein
MVAERKFREGLYSLETSLGEARSLAHSTQENTAALQRIHEQKQRQWTHFIEDQNNKWQELEGRERAMLEQEREA